MQKGIGSLIIAVAFISYGIYCLIKGGTHHKDAGWVSKEERSKEHHVCHGSIFFHWNFINFLLYFPKFYSLNLLKK